MRFDSYDTPSGPGVVIHLDGNEVAQAIDAYLVAHGVHVGGPRTVRVDQPPSGATGPGRVFVDPSGRVIADGVTIVPGEGTESDKSLVAEWLREEALNIEKVLNGGKRLDFLAWKRQRDERARTGAGGAA